MRRGNFYARNGYLIRKFDGNEMKIDTGTGIGIARREREERGSKPILAAYTLYRLLSTSGIKLQKKTFLKTGKSEKNPW